MNKILISGVTGFVGKNLKSFLEQNDYNIVGLSRKQNNKNYNYYNLDVSYLNRFDTFVHLAGKAHDLAKTSKESDYFEVNTELTKRLYEVFLESTATNFIFLSSVKAVADSVDGVLTEETIPNPKTAYGKSKLAAESYLFSQKLPKNKNLYILRPCMIHGPGNKGNLNLLFTLVKYGIPYPLGAYKNKRSFLSVNNLCKIILNFIEKTPENGIYNVCDDEPLSTNEVVETMFITLNKKTRIMNVPKFIIRTIAKAGDVLPLPLNSERLKKLTENYIVSNTKIKSRLNLNSTFDSKEGLSLTTRTFLNEK